MKTQMKRLLVLLLSVALCLSMAACSSSAGNTSSTTNTDNATTGNTATTTENSTGQSSADSALSAALYQSGSTLEISASGAFIEDFLSAVEAGKYCELYFSLKAEEDTLFIFNAFSDGEFISTYCYDFETEEGDAVDSMYGGDGFVGSYQGYTGDFSKITSLDVYALVGEEFLDGGTFGVGSIMLGSSIFGSGSEYADADGAGDADVDQDAEEDTAQDFFEAYEGTYYVHNNSNYTLPLTVTTDTTGADIVFIHNDCTYQISCSVSDLVATDFDENCIVFTQGEDNVVVYFTKSGTSPYVCIYANFLDGDTAESWGYEYKREDQITTVDEAFISEYMGEYLDIESGQDLCNLGLYNGGYLGYKDVDGVSYTVDTILGAELVNDNQVNVTLTASDGTTFDASISFGYNAGALRASVNNGWIMEAVD